MAARNRTLTLEPQERCRLVADLDHGTDLCGGTLADASAFLDRTLCLDSLQLIPRLPGELFDLVVADPPYAIPKDFGAHRAGAMGPDAYEAWLETWLPGVVAAMKPGATLYLCGDWRSSGAIERSLRQYLTVRNRITWEREKGRAALENWKNASEDIWFATKGPARVFDLEAVRHRRRVRAPYRQEGSPKDWIEAEVPYRDTAPGNLWTDCTVPFWSMAENTPHPTQKPEKLLAKLILASSKPGDLVFDPFAGSGTTGVVARKLGRHWCMAEIDPQWVCYSTRRLELVEANPGIQGYADGVFLERNWGKHL